MVFKVSVKTTWRFSNGSRLESGMTVTLQSKQTSTANLLNQGMPEVSDAFMRCYGIPIPISQFGASTDHLIAIKI